MLPTSILQAQWRDCCILSQRMAMNLDPKSYCVYPMTDYSIEHLWTFARLVSDELKWRDISYDWDHFWKYWKGEKYIEVDFEDLFEYWHDERYYWLCYHLLEEMYNCCLVDVQEWEKICDEVSLKL